MKAKITYNEPINQDSNFKEKTKGSDLFIPLLPTAFDGFSDGK